MNLMDIPGDGELHVTRVRVLSGVRPAGRRIDQWQRGRRTYGFFYLKGGQARFWEGQRQITVQSDQLLFLPKDCRYTMEYLGESTEFVLVDFDLFTTEGAPVTTTGSITPVAGQHFEKTMLKMEQCGLAEDLSAGFRRKELLYRLLSLVFEKDVAAQTDGPFYPQIAPGTRLLQNSYLENIPITEFARVSNISVSSFRELFKKQYGESPVRYRNRLRIRRAAALLEEGSCTVAEAAYAAGFDNLGYFCRCYKKITGKTPSQSK